MRHIAVVILALVMLGIGTLHAGQQAKGGPAQKKCPISGKKVDGSTFVDVDGFRILTAGEKESDEVRKNPGKAFATLAKNNEAAEPVAWICPIMQNPVSREYPFVQQDGKRIYYCCNPCNGRIRKDFKGASATMKKLAEKHG